MNIETVTSLDTNTSALVSPLPSPEASPKDETYGVSGHTARTAAPTINAQADQAESEECMDHDGTSASSTISGSYHDEPWNGNAFAAQLGTHLAHTAAADTASNTYFTHSTTVGSVGAYCNNELLGSGSCVENAANGTTADSWNGGNGNAASTLNSSGGGGNGLYGSGLLDANAGYLQQFRNAQFTQNTLPNNSHYLSSPYASGSMAAPSSNALAFAAANTGNALPPHPASAYPSPAAATSSYDLSRAQGFVGVYGGYVPSAVNATQQHRQYAPSAAYGGVATSTALGQGLDNNYVNAGATARLPSQVWYDPQTPVYEKYANNAHSQLLQGNLYNAAGYGNASSDGLLRGDAYNTAAAGYGNASSTAYTGTNQSVGDDNALWYNMY